MSKFTIHVEDDGSIGREYDHDYIMENPMPAKCAKCGERFVDGPVRMAGFTAKGRLVERTVFCRDAIRAPELSNCRCWKCCGQLTPLERGGPKTVEQAEQQRLRSAEQPILEVFL